MTSLDCQANTTQSAAAHGLARGSSESTAPHSINDTTTHASHRSTPPTAIRLDWRDDDDTHPWRWHTGKKWATAVLALLFNSSTAFNGTSYASARTRAAAEIGTTETLWLVGMTTYLVPLALMPLILAPLTERYGRRPTNIAAMSIYTAMFLPQALVPRLDAILISRAVQGAAGSVGNTMASAVLADLFPKHERLLPMAASVWCVLTSQAAGSTAGVWTVYNAHLGWRWVFWWLGAVSLGSLCLVTLFLPETRSTILLKRKADKLTQQTGIRHYVDQGPIGSTSARGVMLERMLRPCVFFFPEPIVATLSLWVGFLWGVVFLSLEGVPQTLAVYDDLDEPRRTSFLALLSLGATLGLAFQAVSIRQYAKQRARNPTVAPEIRLHWCMPAAVMTCVGLFIFAWTSRANISPVVPAIGLAVFSWGVYEIYLGTLTYLADAYETYASSGIACQALMRNIFAGTFGLFATPMYNKLTPPIATSVLASITGLLGLAPFLIVRFGPTLRRRSRVAVLLAARDNDNNSDEKEARRGDPEAAAVHPV